MLKTTLTAVGVAALIAATPHAFATVTNCGTQTSTADRAAAGDLVDVAAAAGSFDTLLKAAKAAGLVPTLKGEGPFTIFAPTDAAFASLPKGALDALLKDRAKLAAVLTYHVVPGRVMAKDVVKIDEAATVNGKRVKIAVDADGVKVDDARVVKTDVSASNGVIHVIDRVILPAEG